jgi:hypothetical protein
MGRRLQSHFFKVLSEIVSNDWVKRRTNRHTVCLLVELSIEAEKGKVRTWRKSRKIAS